MCLGGSRIGPWSETHAVCRSLILCCQLMCTLDSRSGVVVWVVRGIPAPQECRRDPSGLRLFRQRLVYLRGHLGGDELRRVVWGGALPEGMTGAQTLKWVHRRQDVVVVGRIPDTSHSLGLICGMCGGKVGRGPEAEDQARVLSMKGLTPQGKKFRHDLVCREARGAQGRGGKALAKSRTASRAREAAGSRRGALLGLSPCLSAADGWMGKPGFSRMLALGKT